ncbi:MAG: pilus assembly protein TadG-related protein [Dehalococcoidia bacterium]|nr:pilus assembly protein TadG-related protein [Dehalococcoidia bacterium]
MRSLFRWLRPASLRNERGNVLVLFAAGLTAFLGFVGMSVDVGHLVYTRTDLQKVADAAALAAAMDLPDEATARGIANEYVLKNGGPRTSATVSFTEGSRVVTVEAERQVDFWFLRVLGLDGSHPSARAAVRSEVVTGYAFDDTDVFPYAVWGGNPNPPPGCPYGICPGSIQTYRNNQYRNQVKPNFRNNPNWDVGSNTFKGYFHHGTEIVHLNPGEWQTFSNGGNAIGLEPVQALHEHYLSGRPIIVPVIQAARECNGSTGISCPGGDIQFKIVGWVALELTADPLTLPSSADWQGRVIANYSSPAGAINGQHQPPSEWQTRTSWMVE